jgi:hypothetical protein
VLTTGLSVGLKVGLVGGKGPLNAGGSVGACPAASFNKRKETKKPAFRGDALDVENTMVNYGEWNSNAYRLVFYPCMDLYLLFRSY